MNGYRIGQTLFPALMLAATGCQQSAPVTTPQMQPPAVLVEVAPVKVGVATEQVRAVGSVLADEAVVIRAEAAGRVESLHFAEGRAVARGQVLFILDAKEQQAQLAQSEAAMALSELDHKRIAELRAKKVASQQDYDQAVARLREAQAKVALDRARLEKTSIRAPFSGQVGIREVSPGDYVEIAQGLVNLEALDPVKINFNIPGRLVHRVRQTQTLLAAVDAYPDRTFTGEVYAINPRLDARTRSVQVRGQVANPEHLLRPGMFAQVTLVLEERDEALWVPEQALVPIGADRFVYRIEDLEAAPNVGLDPGIVRADPPTPPKPTARAVLTRVETGARKIGEVEIRAGLDRRDTVVVAGQIKLRDGARVTPEPSRPTSAAAAMSER